MESIKELDGGIAMHTFQDAVQRAVKDCIERPDELDVQVPVYQQTGERQAYVVKCAIEIDTVNRLLQLVPLPDELERVIDLAQASIHERLIAALGDLDGQKAIPVYCGKP